MGDFIQVNVSNSQNDAISFEKKFPKDLKIGNLKLKLEVITGGCAGTMQVQLYNGDRFVTNLNDDNTELGSYPIENNMRIHVIDNFQLFADSVEKFDLTDMQYDQKRNTVRDYLKTNKLGKYNADEMRAIEKRKQEELRRQQQIADTINIGDRCLVTAKGPRRIGTVMYTGPLNGKSGIFVGVKFDEPLGIHDGSVNGKRYFTFPLKYGSIVPVMSIEIGHFPAENFDFNFNEEI